MFFLGKPNITTNPNPDPNPTNRLLVSNTFMMPIQHSTTEGERTLASGNKEDYTSKLLYNNYYVGYSVTKCLQSYLYDCLHQYNNKLALTLYPLENWKEE